MQERERGKASEAAKRALEPSQETSAELQPAGPVASADGRV